MRTRSPKVDFVNDLTDPEDSGEVMRRLCAAKGCSPECSWVAHHAERLEVWSILFFIAAMALGGLALHLWIPRP